jgi:hypothetical protein
MDGLRAKVQAKVADDHIHVSIEWVNVVNSQPGEVQAIEEFRVPLDRPDCAYFSRAVFPGGEFEAGTFWVDSQGRRHFTIAADPGTFAFTGEDVAS